MNFDKEKKMLQEARELEFSACDSIHNKCTMRLNQMINRGQIEEAYQLILTIPYCRAKEKWLSIIYKYRPESPK